MKPRVALIYDWVNTRYGGAEKVLQALHQIYPQAPLYTSVYDPQQAKWAKSFKVVPSFLQKIPWAGRLHRWLAPLMPLAFEQLDLSEFEIVISITSAEAKGVITSPNQLHICYLLTPTRYLYSHKQQYFHSLPKFFGVQSVANIFARYLTWWDQTSAARPDIYISISQLVATRAQKYYNQSSRLILYPPVDTLKKETPTSKTNRTTTPYFLMVARLVPYKGVETAIKACIKSQKRLLIVGAGPEKNKLKRLIQKLHASGTIQILGEVSESRLKQLYKQAQALLMPGEEDFGITALEALAQNTPVIINKKSGAAELIKAGKTGEHLEENSVVELKKVLAKFEKFNYKTAIMKSTVAAHSRNSFKKKFERVIVSLWKEHHGLS